MVSRLPLPAPCCALHPPVWPLPDCADPAAVTASPLVAASNCCWATVRACCASCTATVAVLTLAGSAPFRSRASFALADTNAARSLWSVAGAAGACSSASFAWAAARVAAAVLHRRSDRPVRNAEWSQVRRQRARQCDQKVGRAAKAADESSDVFRFVGSCASDRVRRVGRTFRREFPGAAARRAGSAPTRPPGRAPACRAWIGPCRPCGG